MRYACQQTAVCISYIAFQHVLQPSLQDSALCSSVQSAGAHRPGQLLLLPQLALQISPLLGFEPWAASLESS